MKVNFGNKSKRNELRNNWSDCKSRVFTSMTNVNIVKLHILIKMKTHHIFFFL